jgi:hypothetical protein
VFFSEEKNQKTFIPGLYRYVRPWAERWELLKVKVFCFFSSEKKSFLLAWLGSQGPAIDDRQTNFELRDSASATCHPYPARPVRLLSGGWIYASMLAQLSRMVVARGLFGPLSVR